MYQLYYYPNNASLAPHLLLEEMGADYELVLVDRTTDAQKSADYLKLNPSGRIPTLVDGDLVLFESAAICIYACENDPAARFMPAMGHPDRPLFFQWLTYLTNTVQADLMVYFYPDRHTTDEKMTGSIVAAEDARLVSMFGLLDDVLDDRQYLVGKSVSACDHFLLMLSLWADEISRPPLEFANLRRYLCNLAKRDAIRRVCDMEQISLDDYS